RGAARGRDEHLPQARSLRLAVAVGVQVEIGLERRIVRRRVLFAALGEKPHLRGEHAADEEVLAVEVERERILVEALFVPVALLAVAEEAHLLREPIAYAAVVPVEPADEGLAVQDLVVDRLCSQGLLLVRGRGDARLPGEVGAELREAIGGEERGRGRRRRPWRPARDGDALEGEQRHSHRQEVERGWPAPAHLSSSSAPHWSPATAACARRPGYRCGSRPRPRGLSGRRAIGPLRWSRCG